MANYRKDERLRGTEQPGSGYGTAPGEELDYPRRADGFPNPDEVLRAMALEREMNGMAAPYAGAQGGFGQPEHVSGTRSVGFGAQEPWNGALQAGRLFKTGVRPRHDVQRALQYAYGNGLARLDGVHRHRERIRAGLLDRHGVRRHHHHPGAEGPHASDRLHLRRREPGSSEHHPEGGRDER